ncbi:MAG: 2-phospho-L-lactate transferase [Caldilineaceae bacterium]|nr:2-phospho-L-lactate transferase [Caldilineaceae bacterium]
MTLSHIVALAGGVGGAKMAAGLQAALPGGALTVVVNTGDDFEHWGLTICPDLDTVVYNLAGVNNPATGWGRVHETGQVLQAMSDLGGEDWFRLGDRDLALHLRRSEWLRQGISLSEVTDRLRRSFGVSTLVLPMCDEPVRTLVHTDEGDLPFQHYFVRRRCEPLVIDLSYVGADEARVPDSVFDAVSAADLIVLCPSNPYLSIDPILSVPAMRRLLRDAHAWKIAVTPIVGGEAIKGPAAKMMREMGQMISPLTVVDHYADLLDAFVLDNADAVLHDAVQLPTLITDTVMTDLASKQRLAQEILDFAAGLAGADDLPAGSPDARLPASS